MKKLVLIILLSIGMATPCLCQQYFNIRNHFHSSSTVLTSVIEHNQKYYVTGLCIDSSNYINNDSFVCWGVKFMVFDISGNLLRDTFYQKNYLRILQAWTTSSLYYTNDNNFTLAIQLNDTNTWDALIIKFDSLGNRLWEKEYSQPICNDNQWYKVTDFKPTNTGEWLLLSDVYCDINLLPHQQNVMVLQKLDSSFNLIWSKSYASTTGNHIPTKILAEQNDYIIAGGTDNTNLVNAGYFFKPEIIKTDTAGVVIWDWIRSAGFCNKANDIIRTQDGGYVYCGGGDGYEDAGPNFKGWVEKLDSGRNSVWSKSFNQYYWTTQFRMVKETTQGDILLFGDKYCPFRMDSINVNMHTRGWYLKLNSNGDSLAEHTYYKVRSCDDENHIYDVKQTTDGGYIMVGESTDYCGNAVAPTQRGWIVKIDSNGCVDPMTCDQQDTSTEVKGIATNASTISVYPNPAKEQLQIDYTNIVDGQITITDLMGRQLIKKQLTHTLDIKSLANGVYIYRVTEKGIIKGQGKVVKE